MQVLHNPILPGFNPDPSIIRVGSDYYIATSTFEWFPGVQIHHSRDLVHWRLLTRPLSRVSQLDMRGLPDSCGVWAPCLSHDDGRFYLVYTNTRSFDGPWKDTPNYLVTAEHIEGPWSDPIYLNASGFDPSLFHDEDGRKWIVNMQVEHRGSALFGGIVLQELDLEQGKLVGPIHKIFHQTELGCTEGPHLYRRNGWYYLVLAEGGTEYGHAVTVARAKAITGPYTVHPQNPIISSRDVPEHPLQKAGHADMVDSPDGQTYMCFLVGRPLSKRGFTITGRESAMERLVWGEDGWPRTEHGAPTPRMVVPDIPTQPHPFPAPPIRDDFDGPEIDLQWQSLRIPMDARWLSLTERPGWLRLRGRESLSSLHEQSLVGRRLTSRHAYAATRLDFQPESPQQMAGLVAYYNTYHWHYLHVTASDAEQREARIITCDKHRIREHPAKPLALPREGAIVLAMDYNGAALQFSIAVGEGQPRTIGPVLDGAILSDEYVCDEAVRYRPAFTGAFVALACQDLSGRGRQADFDWFDYVDQEMD